MNQQPSYLDEDGAGNIPLHPVPAFPESGFLPELRSLIPGGQLPRLVREAESLGDGQSRRLEVKISLKVFRG